jgi:very-short-patch-repair endonuclease
VGVYRVAGAPPSWRQRLLAACLACGRGAVASHRAAAALWAFPGVAEGTVEVSVPGERRVARPGILVHRASALPHVDLAVVDAVPVTAPTRTVVDLAAVAPPEVVEEALDDAIRRGLTTPRRLAWRLEALGCQGRRGAAAIRALLAARGAGPVPESVLETRLLRVLATAGLPAPVRQHRVRAAGRSVAVVDAAYPGSRVAVAAEGYRWHGGRARWARDLARRNALTALGWRVIHVTWSDLQDRPEEVVGLIGRALASAGDGRGAGDGRR